MQVRSAVSYLDTFTMSAFNSEENIQSGRVEWHDTIQKAISDRGLDEEVAATVSNTTINDDGCNNNNEDENESCSSAYRSCWKLTLAQANGKLWGGGAGGSVL